MKSPVHRSEFIRRLRSDIPEVEPYLRGNRQNLTLEMMAVLLLAEDAIEDTDHQLLSRLFALLANAHAEANRRVRAAIEVSVLEGLDFAGENGKSAFARMNPYLQAEWQATHERMYQLVGKPIPVVGGSPSNHSLHRTRPTARRGSLRSARLVGRAGELRIR